MKEIWIINQYAYPSDYGGITRHTDFAKQLVRNGYHVKIFCSNYVHLKNHFMKEKKETVNGVEYIYINTTKYSGNGKARYINMAFFSFNTFFKMIRMKKPYVIIGSTPHLLSPLCGILISKIKRINSILEVRDLWPETFIQYGILDKNSKMVKILKRIEKYCYKNADHIVATTPNMSEYISEQIGEKKPISHISNGIDTELYGINHKNFSYKEKYDFEFSNVTKILYAGHHGVANDLDSFLELGEIIKNSGKMNDYQLCFIGDGPQKEEFIQSSNKRGLDNFIFHPSIEKKYMPSLYDEADILLIALKDLELYSKYGISLNKLPEYIFTGKPILFIGKPLNNLVNETDSGISVKRITDLSIDDLERLRNFESDVDRMKLEITRNFSIEVLVNKLIDVIEGV